jgi:PST family polysaccharide transporter
LTQIIYRLKNRAAKHSSFIKNFSYLSALQIFNLILPLITFPYLIRVLGKETYGLVVFAQALISYLAILVGFGFNISGTKEVSIHRNDKTKLSEIVSSILILKLMLMLVAFLILGVLMFFIPRTHGYITLFLLSMWVCLYDVIFPIWYFQGVEQMKYIAFITMASRLSFLGLIFIFIHAPEDFLFVPLLYGLGALVAGSIAMIIIFIKHKIQFKTQSYSILKYYFKDSIPIFVSNVSISLYVNTNKIIAGAFLGMAEVAYYDLAEKLTTVLKIPQNILSQTLFPKISKEKNLGFIKRLFRMTVILNMGLFFLSLIFVKFIILILGGTQMLPAQTVVIILTITVPIIAMSNIFGIQLLIPFGYSKLFSRVVFTSALFYILQMFILWITIGFSVESISIATVNNEIFCCAYLFYYCKKCKLW